MAKISLLIADGCVSSSATTLIDAFFIANRWHKQYTGNEDTDLFETQIISPTGRAVEAQSNIQINADLSIENFTDSDCVFVSPFLPFSHPRPKDLEKICTWLTKIRKENILITTVCTGTFILAETGMLDMKKASTNWQFAKLFKKKYPKVKLSPQDIITADDNIITTGAATAVNNLALYLIKKFGSRKLASVCSKALLIDPNRHDQSPYIMLLPYKSHGDKQILKAQELIETEFEKLKNIDDIASKVGISPRHFKRRFIKATGEQPSKYLQKVRIDAAKDWLENTQENIDNITYSIGYHDTSSFCRLFKTHTKISPKMYREKFYINTNYLQ